ncbi:MAG TPA: hypothetical protein VL651_09680 [Bacteroidia bacterium]|jgi:hypothetical protein|nr:hypothetical protein [Bacteroidia bacterium]
MKKILLSALVALIAVALPAQKLKISVDEKNMTINGGSHNCLVVTVYDASIDDIMKEWRSKMKGFDGKTSGSDEVFADNALIKTISENTCDVYARAEKGSDDHQVTFIVGFLLGETWLTSSNTDSYKAAEKLVKDFATEMSKSGMDAIVKAEQKKLDALKDEQSDLVKKNKDLNDDIADWQAKIKKAQDDIAANEDAQKKKQAEIDDQTKVLDAAKQRQSSIE